MAFLGQEYAFLKWPKHGVIGCWLDADGVWQPFVRTINAGEGWFPSHYMIAYGYEGVDYSRLPK